MISGDTFVAFDVETTNRNAKTTSATEIGAIRVVNGKIDESASFVFQEIVHPIDSKISPEVEELTGITNDMVKDARKIKEVFNDFADFIGDDVLVGYNCISFDSKVITRSGRYAERVIENPYYEVLYPARKYKKDNNLENARLETVSEALGIKVTEAHRALADAITTARVYLKLKELGYTKDSDSVDELLDDEDLW